MDNCTLTIINILEMNRIVVPNKITKQSQVFTCNFSYK